MGDRYQRMTLVIEAKGMVCFNCPLEVGSRGVISERNHRMLAMIASICRIRYVKNLKRKVSKIALLGTAQRR